jgi:hypothetical protein
MRTLRRLLKRLTSWATRRQDEERLQAEIEEHLALQAAENLRAGLSPVEARRQAVLKFGAVEALKESYRDERGLPFMETLVQDARQALRRLRLAPAFTLTTVLTLALGTGATTSIFTLVHAILLKSLPVANPGELYRLGKEARCCNWGGFSQEKEFSLVSYQLYQHLRNNTKGFAELAAFSADQPQFGVRRAGRAEPAQSYPGEYVSGNYFSMFGVQAYAGRALTAADDQPGAPPAAMMSYRLWQQQYAADPSVIGSVFTFNGRPFTVVGVTPPGFFGDTLRTDPPDFFLPLNTELLLGGDLNRYSNHWLELIGRIRRGADPALIEADMRVELKQWLLTHWAEMSASDRAKFPEQTLFLSPGGAGISAMRDQYEHWLQILMLVTGFVLLIVCANVANLMLVRGLERRRQISVSMALGARASRIVRQALTESIVLSLLGGAAGLAIAYPRLARRPGTAVRFWCLVDHRDHLRYCARVDGGGHQSDRSSSRRRPFDRSCGFPPEKGPHRISSGALSGVVVSIRIADSRAAQPGESGFRIQPGPENGREHQSRRGRLSSGPAHRAVRADPTIRGAYSRCVRCGAL